MTSSTKFSPRQYASDLGWDASHILATAEHGLSEYDVEAIDAWAGVHDDQWEPPSEEAAREEAAATVRAEQAREALLAWCRAKAAESDLGAMAAVLRSHGERFSGNHVADEAQNWLDHAFSSATADAWCAIGVWDAATAAEFRDAGLTPDQVVAAAAILVEGLEDPAAVYTDGDPIYAACNGDLSPDAIIAAAAE